MSTFLITTKKKERNYDFSIYFLDCHYEHVISKYIFQITRKKVLKTSNSKPEPISPQRNTWEEDAWILDKLLIDSV